MQNIRNFTQHKLKYKYKTSILKETLGLVSLFLLTFYEKWNVIC
jgi:hypothetical protein